jgi:hypothetical protein
VKDVIIPDMTIITSKIALTRLVSALKTDRRVNGKIGNKQGDKPVAKPAKMKKGSKPICSLIIMPKNGKSTINSATACISC